MRGINHGVNHGQHRTQKSLVRSAFHTPRTAVEPASPPIPVDPGRVLAEAAVQAQLPTNHSDATAIAHGTATETAYFSVETSYSRTPFTPQTSFTSQQWWALAG